MSETHGTTTNTTVVLPQPPQDDLLNQLVGEGKKFKTVTDLAKGKLESDAFIKKLESENETLRILIANNEDKGKLETPKVTTPTTDTSNLNANQGGTPNQGEQFVKVSDLQAILEANVKAQKETERLNTVMGELTKKYAEKTEEVLKTRAETLGLTVDELKNVAKRSPTAFLNMIGETGGKPSTTLPGSGHNSEAIVAFQSKSGEVRNKAFYDNLSKTMGPTKFMLDKGLQVQLHRDMQRLGDAWDAAG